MTPLDEKPCRQCAREDGDNLIHCELCDGQGCITCNWTGRVDDEEFDWSDHGLCYLHSLEAREASEMEKGD